MTGWGDPYAAPDHRHRRDVKESTMLQRLRKLALNRARARVISLLGLAHLLTAGWAATFTVNSAADGADANPGNGVCATSTNVCTLRAAVGEANALAGDDTVTFSLPAGTTISLTGGAINITSNLIINGPTATSPANQLRVSGGWDSVINSSVGSRVFFINGGASRINVTLRDLALVNGNAGTQGGGADPGSPKSNGGAVYVEKSALTLERTTFSNSTSNDGGAVEVEDATVSISDSTFSGNKARDDGGAIDIGKSPAAVNVTNTTFVNNRSEAGTANGVGGTGGAIRVDGNLSLTYVTMAYNVGGKGGGIDLAATGRITFRNSLVFGNTELDGTTLNCIATNRTVASARTDSGNNWTNSADSCFLGNTITAAALALAAAPGSNGGPTQTLALATTSGVNGVTPPGPDCGAGAGLRDQRAVARAVGGGCEPGAFELQSTPPPADLTLSKSHTGTFVRGATGIYTLRVTNLGAGTATGAVTVSDVLPSGLTYNAASGSGWTVSVSGQTVTATATRALVGSASYPDLTLTVNVLTSAPDSVTNRATVSGGGDATPANNTATDPTVVVAAGLLTLQKAVRNVTQTGGFGEGGVGAPGEVLEYRITFTATGNALYDVVIRDAAPFSTRLVQNSYGAGEVQLVCPGGAVSAVDLGRTFSGTFNLAVTSPGPCGNSLARDASGHLRFQVLIE